MASERTVVGVELDGGVDHVASESGRFLAGDGFVAWPGPAFRAFVDQFVVHNRISSLPSMEKLLTERKIALDLDKDAIEWLADKGYDERMGARPLGRVIQEYIKKPLAEELLFGKLVKGGLVRVNVKDDAIVLDIEEPAKPRLTGQKPPLLTAE